MSAELDASSALRSSRRVLHAAFFTPAFFTPAFFTPSFFTPTFFTRSDLSPGVLHGRHLQPGVLHTELLHRRRNGAYQSAQYRSLFGISVNDGTANEHIFTNIFNNTGSFYIRVTGRNGAFAPG